MKIKYLLITVVVFIAIYVFKCHNSVVPVFEMELDKLILVNKNNPISEVFKPNDLTLIENNNDKNILIRDEVNTKYKEMLKDASKHSLNMYVVSGYRSYEYQESIFEKNATKDGIDVANTYSAKPGESEHQTGLAIDIGNGVCDVEECFDKSKEYKWLAKNSYKYGFILRYPKNKTDITGYIYEPWHYRYVGVDVAKQIYDSKLTLEEFLKYN